jgi:triphosphatase
VATEAELKLCLDDDARKRVSSLPLIRHYAEGPAVRQRLTSIYYDTPELDLPGKGLVLRVRRQGGQWIQTVKSAGRARAGLHTRAEFEGTVSSRKPDFDQLRGERGLRAFADGALQKRLAPAFETDFWRTSWNLHLPGGEIVEIAMDAGEVRHGDATAPICELELELKRGLPEVLYGVALDIAKQSGCSLK